MKKLTALVLISAIAVTGCTSIDETTGTRVKSNTKTGALIGAAIGAGVGALSHKDGDQKRKNAILGAGIGALAGTAVGGYMDNQTKELREKLAGSGVSVSRVGDTIVLNMPGDITFQTNSAGIEPDFFPVLKDVAQVLNTYPATMIDIVGHADSQGPDDYNQSLSERRATATADYLSTQRVKAERIYVAGMGERQPVATNATPEGRSRNRRVEIKLRPIVQN